VTHRTLDLAGLPGRSSSAPPIRPDITAAGSVFFDVAMRAWDDTADDTLDAAAVRAESARRGDKTERRWVDTRQLRSRYADAFTLWTEMHLREGRNPLEITSAYDVDRIRRAADYQVIPMSITVFLLLLVHSYICMFVDDTRNHKPDIGDSLVATLFTVHIYIYR
jgi:hypothetical protein